MDLARGGHFENIPDFESEKAWYINDDALCNYACQIENYFYWSLTTMLGG
jgi:hypothetical protein